MITNSISPISTFPKDVILTFSILFQTISVAGKQNIGSKIVALKNITAQKNDILPKTAGLVIFTEEILKRKLNFSAVYASYTFLLNTKN